MNTFVTRMAGMRQCVGLAVAAVSLVYFAQEFFVKRPTIPFALPELLLGATLLEHLPGNRLFAVLFSALGLSLSSYASYLLFY